MSRFSYDIALALCQEIKQVTVFSVRTKTKRATVEQRPFSFSTFPFLSNTNVFSLRFFSICIVLIFCLSYMLTHKVKLIVINTWSVLGEASLLLSLIFNIPYFVVAHGFDIRGSMRTRWSFLLMKQILGNSRCVLANSYYTQKEIKSFLLDANVAVVHPCVDLNRFLCNALTKVEPSVTRKKVLSVGRLTENKGHANVIRALPIVLRSVPDILYQIVGIGPEEESLRALTQQLGLSEYVVFEGFVQEEKLSSYYFSCDVFVLASKDNIHTGDVEGFGIVFLEAGACAKPVIGPHSGGVPDAIVDGVTGILVDPNNSNEIADAIVRIVSNPDLAKRLGEHSRERIEAEFTPKELERKLFSILQNNYLYKE